MTPKRQREYFAAKMGVHLICPDCGKKIKSQSIGDDLYWKHLSIMAYQACPIFQRRPGICRGPATDAQIEELFKDDIQ